MVRTATAQAVRTTLKLRAHRQQGPAHNERAAGWQVLTRASVMTCRCGAPSANDNERRTIRPKKYSAVCPRCKNIHI